MSLTFSNITYDESGLVDVDGDTDSNVASLSTALTYQISALSLGSQYYSGANAVTQYAEVTNFITDPNAGATNYVLASDASGDGFSTANGAGVATGLYVGGVEVYLYATTDPNVVVGRIGNTSTGDIAMVIALHETTDGTGHVTGTDLGIEMLAPLTNSLHNPVDDADTTSMLGNALFVYETHSTVSISEFKDFSAVPSGNDAFALIGPSSGSSAVDLLATGFSGSGEGTVNVSTTGLGANAQTVATGSSLRIDTVSANSGDFAKDAMNPQGNYDTNISYQNHVQVIEASFELTQTNPSGKPASLTVSAYETSSNAQGHSFVTDAVASEGSLVKISLSNVHILTDGGTDITSGFGGTITQSGDGKSVVITGLTATEHVDFTADSQFDRFVVTNTQTSPSDKTDFDVGDIKVSTITGGTGHDSGDLGPSLVFEDGGPSVATQADTNAVITVDESALGSASAPVDYSGLFNINYGPDGAAASTPVDYAFAVKSSGVDSGLKDTATGHEIYLYTDGSDVVGRVGSGVSTPDSGGTVDFRISVDSSGNVTFEQDGAVMHSGTAVSDEPATLASSDLVTLTATVHDGDGDSATSQAANIGTTFTILDDEPSMTGHTLATDNFVQVANTIGAQDTNSFTLDTGNDGLSKAPGLGYTIVGPADTSGAWTWAYSDSTHTSIVESYTDSTNTKSAIFSLSLDSSTGGYTVTMINPLPYGHIDLDSSHIKAGGPVGSIDVGTINDNGEYVEISGTSNNTNGQLNGVTASVNASNGNVGVTNGNLDGGEALSFSLYSSTGTLIPFYGLDMGTKTAQSSSYQLYGVLDSDHSIVPLGTDGSPLAKGGVIHYAGDVLLDAIIVEETAGNAVKIGLSGVHLLTAPSDAGFNFTAQLTDGDGDSVTMPFSVYLDGDGGGVNHSLVGFPQ